MSTRAVWMTIHASPDCRGSIVLIAGAHGRLARVLTAGLDAVGHAVIPMGRTDLDICDEEAVFAAVRRIRPTVIVNCAAYNDVDAAEANRETAFAVNGSGPGILAQAADRIGATLIHYSTDFVFDGTARQPYTEDAAANPLNVYGESKLAGEREVSRIERHYIVRVESLFGAVGTPSSVDYVVDRLLAGPPVQAFANRTVTPSYAPDVSRATCELIASEAPWGTYHCVNSGITTWYELARELASHLDAGDRIAPVQAIPSTGRAVRPLFCALSNEKLAAHGIRMPSWRSAIARHLVVRREALQTS